MIELIWPSCCAGCGRVHQGRLCPRCTPAGVHRVEIGGSSIAGTWCLTGYQAGLGRALRQAKVSHDRTLMALLARRFAEALTPALREAPITVVVPVPSPWTRRVRRGFSAAALMARALGAHRALPTCNALVVRPGPRQASLNARARQRNLRGRIRSRRPAPGAVLLVDDVITTGATARACAQELLGDTTRSVWLATLCAARGRTGTSAGNL